MEYSGLIKELNSPSPGERDNALDEILKRERKGELSFPSTSEVNNHVHTFFSYSPYSPTGAAFGAYSSGLQVVGIMDHDSIAGGGEFLSACRKLGIGSTAGVELRTNFYDTPFGKTRLNNPDSIGIAYITVQGIAEKHFSRVKSFLRPLQLERNKRNKAQVKALNTLTGSLSIDRIDYKTDVYGLSKANEGGSITERHIIAALCGKIVSAVGKGRSTVDFIEKHFNISIPGRIRNYLLDTDNPHYMYDMLGVLKGSVLDEFFIQPNEEECLSVKDVIDFALSIDAIPAYAYLGDVAQSPTGDKKAQAFEDSFLDDLFPVLKDLGFKAVTYMPPRNTREQLKRVMVLCEKYDFMQISGVDINSSRQSFNCPELNDPMFSHLNTSTWALVAHEKLTNYDSRFSIFGGTNIFSNLSLGRRIEKYGKFGEKLDPENPVPGRDILLEFEIE